MEAIMESPAGIESRRRRAISCPMSGTELVPYELEKLRRDQARVESGFWGKMRRTLARIPFVDELVAAYYCATDPATPLRAKAVLYGALAYFVLPIDIVPDFIFLFGFTDDAAVLDLKPGWSLVATVDTVILSFAMRRSRPAKSPRVI